MRRDLRGESGHFDIDAALFGIAELPIVLRSGRVADFASHVDSGPQHHKRQTGHIARPTISLGEYRPGQPPSAEPTSRNSSFA